MAQRVPDQRWRRSTRGGWLALALLLGSSGCGGCGGGGAKFAPAPPPGTLEGNLEAICNAYNKAYRELNRAPKSLDEFKTFLKHYGDPAQLMISPRDGEEFVIVLGANPNQEPTPANPQIVAYEKVGKDGTRYTINPIGAIATFTNEQLSRVRFPKGHKPPG